MSREAPFGGRNHYGRGYDTEGVLVLNSLLNPIFVNGAAAQILAYPATFQAQNDLERVLARGPTNPFEGLTISEVCLRLRSIAQSTVTGSTPGAVDGMLFSPRFCRVTAYNKSTIQKN